MMAHIFLSLIIQNDPSWLDLKPVNAREILKIAAGISEHLGKRYH